MHADVCVCACAAAIISRAKKNKKFKPEDTHVHNNENNRAYFKIQQNLKVALQKVTQIRVKTETHSRETDNKTVQTGLKGTAREKDNIKREESCFKGNRKV